MNQWINSDARSAQVVDDRIRPALESGSAIGSSRPVLIVIDEIDGATSGGDNVSCLHLEFTSFCSLLTLFQASGFIHKLVQLTFDNKPKNKSKFSSPCAYPINLYLFYFNFYINNPLPRPKGHLSEKP